MTRAQRIFVFIFCLLGGLIPILVYSMARGGLGAVLFAETKTMSRELQLAQVVAGLFIKPTYMLVSCAFIIGLLGQSAPEITSMRWGLIAFLTGEIFCAINFIVYKHASLVSEYIHSYGMVLAFGFFACAFFEILDQRLLHINSGKCALNELCGTCKRNAPLSCSARRIGLLTLTMMMLASCLPLTVSSSSESYLTNLFGFPYSYARFDFQQWYETRALPVFALLFFMLALLPLLRAKGKPIPHATKILFSAGIGALGFSLFRTALAAMFANHLVWFEFWEEASEWMFISALGFILWQFRNSLLQRTPILNFAFSKLEDDQ